MSDPIYIKSDPLYDSNKYMGYFIIGLRGSGKSALVEKYAEKFYCDGRIVVDLWGASGRENLFWGVKGKTQYPCLIVHSPFVDVEIPKGQGKWYAAVSGDESVESIIKRAVLEKRVVCFDQNSYQGFEEECYKKVAEFLSELPRVNMDVVDGRMVVLVREASNLLFAHLKVNDYCKFTRAPFLSLIRESRHNRISFIIDSQRYKDVYSGVRENTDVLLIKRTPVTTLPDDMSWLPKKIKYLRRKAPFRFRYSLFPKLGELKPEEYYAVFPSTNIVKLNFDLPGFYHKREEDNFSRKTGILFKSNGRKPVNNVCRREDGVILFWFQLTQLRE